MKNIHAFTKKSATVPHKLAFSVLREQHFQGQVSYHGYSPLPFHVSEPAKRRRCLGWNQWENLARFPRNIFPDGKSLPGFRGTFSQAGKPCPARGERLPGREKLAALCGRLSTIICSPPSSPIRPHQGVCDTPLQFLAKYLH